MSTDDRLQEAGGTLLAALIWLVGTTLVFVALGFLTHVVVEVTIQAQSASWKAVVGAVAAMLLVACGGALVVIAGRGVSLVPGRWRRRHQGRPRART